MKKRHLFIFAIAILILHSCIVKSLYPFYTKDTISFDKRFLGVWKDQNPNREWTIASVKDYWQKAIEKPTSPEDVEQYNKIKEGYFVFIKDKYDDDITIFFSMPFKINKQLFLDFNPIQLGCECGEDLVGHHLITTHSLVKFDILNDNSVSIKWFSSEKMKSLFENHKINIKHEKHGSKYLLTASSEELQKFIAKYMVSNDTDKWKTDIDYDLKRIGSPEKSFEFIYKIFNRDGFKTIGEIDFDFNY